MKKLASAALIASLTTVSFAASTQTSATPSTTKPASAATMASAPTSTPTPAPTDPAAAKAQQLLLNLTHDQVTIINSFSVNDSLQGFVVGPKSGPGRPMVMYVDKGGQYLFAGNLINANGQNLTDQYTQQYINTKIASQAALTIADQTHYFTQGKDTAAHKAYVFFDPNCSACHIFYSEVKPLIDAGKLQVRWIPVAFLKPTSPGKAAKILSGKTDKEKAAFLATDESSFDMQKENGGLAPLSANKINKQYFDRVDSNTQYFSTQGFYVTPTIVYKDASGKATYVAGAMPPGPAFDGFIAAIGGSW